MATIVNENECIQTMNQLPDAVRKLLGDDVSVVDTYKGSWTGGYHFKLINGFCISVQFAPGLAGDYKQWLFDQDLRGCSLNEMFDSEHDFSDSKTAEVAAIWKGDMYDLETMKVFAVEADVKFGEYIKTADVLTIIHRFSLFDTVR